MEEKTWNEIIKGSLELPFILEYNQKNNRYCKNHGT